MSTLLRGLVLGAGLILVLAACGGSASQAPSGGAPSGEAPTAGAPTAGSPSDAATDPPTAAASSPAATDPGGGGTAGDVCGLVTAAEMANALGVAATEQLLALGPPDTCGYSADGSSVAALVLTPEGGETVFGMLSLDPEAKQITGIGEQALYSDGTQAFLVIKGGKLLTVAVSVSDDNLPGSREDVMKAIATIAAGRM